MNLTGKQITFHRKQNPFHFGRIALLLALIIAGALIIRAVDRKEIKPINSPTATPTRTSGSLSLEGETHFIAGDLNRAISAYQVALETEPENALLLAEMARIQTYSSASLTTDQQRKDRLQAALDAVNRAVELAPDDSTIHAIRAFVLDWNANPVLAGSNSQALLLKAEQEAVRALQLDNTNTLALAYYAEILVDQQKLIQAEQYIKQAIERDESIMDVHRVYAYVLESSGAYLSAIEEYKRAAEIAPNFTYLYVYIGANYRRLAANDPRSPYYADALDYFDKAAKINEQLGNKDPIPYLSISKTYSQMGEFFIASLNVLKALSFDPTSPDIYGQLGIIRFKARNYEGSILPLKCAIFGCTAVESCEARDCDDETENPTVIAGLPLSDSTVVYYYTYGSVLAGLTKPGQDYCSEAVKVFNLVRAQYGLNRDVMSIVEDGEAICRSYRGTPQP